MTAVRKDDGTRWSLVPIIEGNPEEQPATVSVTILGTPQAGLYSIRVLPPVADEHFEVFKSTCRGAYAEWSMGARAWRLPGDKGAKLVDALQADGFTVELHESRGESEHSLAGVVLSMFGLTTVAKASLDVAGTGYIVRVPDEYDLGLGYECPCDAVAALVLQARGIELSPAASARLQRLRAAGDVT